MVLKKIYKDKVLLSSLYLLFILPIFPSNLKAIVVIFFGLILILNIIGHKNVDFNKKFFLINSSLFLCAVFSLFYTLNISYGLKKLGTMSSLIIFPLVFSLLSPRLIKKTEKRIKGFLLAFIIAVVTINVLFFVYHLEHYGMSIFKHYMTVIRISQGKYNIHPIYMSMHISVSLLFSLFLLFKEKDIKKIALIFLLDLILLFFLFLLLKKGPIIGLFLSILTFVILKNKKKIWFLFLILIFSCFLIVPMNKKIKQKFVELIKIETIKNDDIEATSTDIRYSLYHYSFDTFKKSPLIGYGIGDYRDELIKSYKDNPILFNEKYNSHNQYLSILISLGGVGLLVLFIVLGVNLKLALTSNNHILIVLLIFYSFVMLTENILEREDGVLFFGMFISFFGIFSSFNNKIWVEG